VESSAAELHYRRGNELYSQGRYADALASYDAALRARADLVGALCGRANVFRSLGRPGDAVVDLERALTIEPRHAFVLPMLMEAEMHICKWDRMFDRLALLNAGIDDDRFRVSPLVLMMCVSDPARQFKGFRGYVQNLLRSCPVVPRPRVWAHEKIRLAYVSSDFRQHAVSFLAAELFERHDRDRFEVIAISHGPDDESPLRRRLVAAFDEFHDVRSMSDQAIADLMRRREIDIAVDLSGLTALGRIGILARRPAATQVSWLGYPATTGADFIDYIVADPIALPAALQPFFTEKIVHLPECYFLRDTKQTVAPAKTRTEVGLPSGGFVFCCFSQSYKFTPGIFDIWMRVLRRVEGSILWLAMAHPPAIANLRREAAARGIDPARLIFAPQVDISEHLARQRHADLFLDTIPFNAVTTAMDALWMGVPLLTCLGRTFVGRGAASALQAIGTPELITGNLRDYETLALQLAQEPARLAVIRAKLAHNRSTAPPFDVDRFRRNIEAAYLTMHRAAGAAATTP
jgi:protein O-GlcNAc transferase